MIFAATSNDGTATPIRFAGGVNAVIKKMPVFVFVNGWVVALIQTFIAV